MSERQAKMVRKVRDHEMVQDLIRQRDTLRNELNKRNTQLAVMANGLRQLGAKIHTLRKELGPLKFAVDNSPYLAAKRTLEIYEESFSYIAGCQVGSKPYENAIILAATHKEAQE